ncbi:MAG: hypothetical protein O2798_05115 [Chloroflexi bacterium]|nr:hypothetical protein [Chloroflexota bacterium]MDA1240208.1 hypothetical protein [Chloroflexota bacterium]MQC47822.1 hypothetical protein [Chloroflexota bacterium]
MGSKQSLRVAAGAAVAGLAWGYMRHRRDPRASSFAVLQALEWFIAYGGAIALIELVRGALDEDDDLEVTERITHIRQTVFDQAAGEG